MPIDLPPGWVITSMIEEVPNPNVGTPAAAAGNFARLTYICTDENNQYVCSSGSESDCENQAQTMAQCRTQQQPYYEPTS